MATKTFINFRELDLATDDSIARTDFVVGYRPATETTAAEEIKITAEQMFNTADDLLNPVSIRGDKIQFIPDGKDASINDINVKLNQFKSVEDYQSSSSAGENAYNQRLFIPNGKTVKIKPNISESNSINNIFSSIKNWHIEGLVQIDLSSSTETNIVWEVNGSINLNHPFGHNIQLLGALDANSVPKVTIRMSATSSAYNILACTNGHVFGLIDSISVVGNLQVSGSYAGICADAGGQIMLGTNVTVSSCPYGIMSSRGGTLIGDYVGIRTSACSVAGFCASSGGHLSAKRTTASNCTGTGYLAEYNSQLICDGATASNNTLDGFTATSNSQIKATGAIASGNQRSGFLAKQSGEIECPSESSNGLNTQALNNSRYGVEFDGAAKIYGDFSVMSTNNLGAISPNVTLVASENQSGRQTAVVSSKGDLTVKTSDSGSIYFKTRDVDTQFQVVGSTTLRTSYITVKGGNNMGDVPTIKAEKSSAFAQGTEQINLGLKLEGNGGYVNLGELIKFETPLTKPGLSDQNLVPNGYLSIRVGNKIVYLLVHEP